MPNELAQVNTASVVAPAPQASPAPEIPPPLDRIAAGQVPATTVPPIVQRQADPLQAWLVDNLDLLPDLGLDLYEPDPKGDPISVVYNPSQISEEQLSTAYSAGKLPEVAPPVQQLLQPQAAPPAAGTGPTSAPLASAAVPAAKTAPTASNALGTVSTSTGKRLETARINSLKTPAPIKPNPVPEQLARRAV